MNTRYIFHQKYILFPLEDTTGNLLRWYLTTFAEKRALHCFTTVYGDMNEIRKHINVIEDYIEKFEQTFAVQTELTVQMHTDEQHNYTGVKTLHAGRRYEAVHVRHEDGEADYNHMLIQLDEYDIHDFDKLVEGFGYADLQDFLQERGAHVPDIIVANINIDYNSASWISIAEELVVFIVESTTGRTMSSERANTLAKRFGI